MTGTNPYLVHDLLVALDYGHFSLFGGYSGDVDYMDLLDKAQAGPGIASYQFGVVVRSPHQNNFYMPLRVECWHQRPPDDTDQWNEVTECVFTVENGTLYYQSPTLATTACAVPDGRYAYGSVARGFVNRGWPGSTEPGDVWRIQLWPSTGEFADRRLKAWQP